MFEPVIDEPEFSLVAGIASDAPLHIAMTRSGAHTIMDFSVG